jgi:hypothetical protein
LAGSPTAIQGRSGATNSAHDLPAAPGGETSATYSRSTASAHGTDRRRWPQPGSLDRAYAALTEEFAARRPEAHTFTWYDPDQSVAFWIRRMAQETVIHRVDAELGAGAAIAPIPDDLAADGIDELLVAFVQYGTITWPDEFTELLASAGGRTVRAATPLRSWLP